MKAIRQSSRLTTSEPTRRSPSSLGCHTQSPVRQRSTIARLYEAPAKGRSAVAVAGFAVGFWSGDIERSPTARSGAGPQTARSRRLGALFRGGEGLLCVGFCAFCARGVATGVPCVCRPMLEGSTAKVGQGVGARHQHSCRSADVGRNMGARRHPRGDEMAPPARSTLTANATTPAPTVESAGQVAAAMRPLIDGLLGREVPLRFEFWERSMLCHDQSVATLRFNSPDSI